MSSTPQHARAPCVTVVASLLAYVLPLPQTGRVYSKIIFATAPTSPANFNLVDTYYSLQETSCVFHGTSGPPHIPESHDGRPITQGQDEDYGTQGRSVRTIRMFSVPIAKRSSFGSPSPRVSMPPPYEYLGRKPPSPDNPDPVLEELARDYPPWCSPVAPHIAIN
ncbi:hypothetical protein C8T65DRAFT_144993 [Cerioporus squamosus]|nr:hypothetical protein C8T65DRAFT_144993 [Cerioporus squamosus]